MRFYCRFPRCGKLSGPRQLWCSPHYERMYRMAEGTQEKLQILFRQVYGRPTLRMWYSPTKILGKHDPLTLEKLVDAANKAKEFSGGLYYIPKL